MRRLTVLRSPVGAASAVLLTVLLALAIFAPLLWGDRAAAIDTDALQQGPSADHLLGTDQLGRDIFFRVLVATRLTIGLALLATVIGVVTGLVLGSVPSVLPRWAARIVTAGVNIAVAFPGLLLALFFAVIFGTGTIGAVLAIAFAITPSFARLTQTLTASVSGRDFIAAARVCGVGRFRLLTRHVLPNIAEPLVINATLAAGSALTAFAGLSFLGIGVQAPSYDWGRLLGEGLNRIYISPAPALGPAVAVVLAGLAFNLFGEAAAAGHRQRSHRAATLVPKTTSAPADGGLLTVRNLHVSFPGGITPVRGVSFTVHKGEMIGVVGESGSGKSLTALAVSRLVEHPGTVTADTLEFNGKPLDRTPDRELGTRLAMVFQDPTTSFNPTKRIGRQIAEVSEVHQGLSRRAATRKAVDRLDAVRIPEPERRAKQYPHEFSGGMRQRAMIAMGLMGEPQLVIADEPTTALDVTVQREVLKLLATIRQDRSAAVLLISHDITVVAQTCDRVLVMYAGRIVEELPTEELFTAAQHPYTTALLKAVPDLDTDRDAPLAVIPGRPPEPGEIGRGCPFAPRCPLADDQCRTEEPELTTLRQDHRVACWKSETELAGVR
ncbi:dipeptide/oligopeptide/nickel ABC transporter permease/ATP-binding protein [Lentzea albidocapillata]|uniref:Oligopeptide/dipeptide ABC transporter, ATP-binding protein, C-terminal domain-containing protein n=1 Tax=Lentzea albidocapillata TaxID=40571 RepID=A0A1W2BWJ4_9PSEU|nr:dipeptide/oligopeptide/nickel ABC transporter permease/ATP-binding protein [Lentzea albidocapillata]SMC77367.1 oligopeptide/dipeptide ABC transporter, ATP-binding protein, C-terminal domain-containing protein [Lentzea albidocapillata]